MKNSEKFFKSIYFWFFVLIFSFHVISEFFPVNPIFINPIKVFLKKEEKGKSQIIYYGVSKNKGSGGAIVIKRKGDNR